MHTTGTELTGVVLTTTHWTHQATVTKGVQQPTLTLYFAWRRGLVLASGKDILSESSTPTMTCSGALGDRAGGGSGEGSGACERSLNCPAGEILNGEKGTKTVTKSGYTLE